MKVLQIATPNIPDTIRKCMDTVSAIYPAVKVISLNKFKNPVIDSDNMLIDILSKESDILFIDWDVEVYEPFKIINNNLPSFEYFKGTPDLSIIYSPKKEFWHKVENERVRRGIDKNVYVWPRKILRYMNTNEICGSYKHLRYSSGEH